jgi:hypothetical protein
MKAEIRELKSEERKPQFLRNTAEIARSAKLRGIGEKTT